MAAATSGGWLTAATAVSPPQFKREMTILIAFHQSAYRNFKWFYTQLVCRYWRNAFPGLVSYNRFVEWMPSVLIPSIVCLLAPLLWQLYRD